MQDLNEKLRKSEASIKVCCCINLLAGRIYEVDLAGLQGMGVERRLFVRGGGGGGTNVSGVTSFLTTCPQGKLDMKISCPE